MFLEVKEVQNFHVTPRPNPKATEKTPKEAEFDFFAAISSFFFSHPLKKHVILVPHSWDRIEVILPSFQMLTR